MSLWNKEVVPTPKQELEAKEEKTQQARYYKLLQAGDRHR